MKSKPSNARDGVAAAVVSDKPTPKAGMKASSKSSARPDTKATRATPVTHSPAETQAAITAPQPPSEPPAPLSTTVLTSLAGTPVEAISLLFDAEWYAAEYADVAAAGMDPIRHFFDNGAQEGRRPNAYFDTTWYLENNADVVASKMNPFLHYLLYGAREGRKPRP